MKNTTKKYMMVILCAGLLVACGTRTVTVADCIPPSTNFAYKASSEGIGNYPENEVLPPLPWKAETEIPYPAPQLLAIRNIDNRVAEIWISAATLEPHTPYKREILTYRTGTQRWEPVSLEEGLYSSNPILYLYVTRDNLVLAFHPAFSSQDSFPVLSQYDESSRSFQFVDAIDSVPNGSTRENRRIRTYNQVLLDANSVFWILVPDDYIYSFDPKTGEIVRHSPIAGIFLDDAALSPDGGVYILDRTGTEDQLFHYLPETDEMRRIHYGLEEQPGIPNLLVDHSGRLWAGGLGWMETDGTWYQILRSPLFVTTNLDLGGDRVYRWQQPSILLESLDHTLWFVAANGMFSLDPQEGEWCWFSTAHSNIIEDSERNLWMIADGKLYKLDFDN